MKNTRIYGALIIIAIALALFLLVFFGVDIKVSKQLNIYYNSAEPSNVYISLNHKQQQYVSNQDTTKKYSIVNPINKNDINQVRLYPYSIDNEPYIYRFDLPSTWSESLVGLNPTSFTFGNMKLFQSFIWF